MSAATIDESDDAQKGPVEALALRANPRPIARFKRGLLIGAAAVGAVGLSALAWAALTPRAGETHTQEAPAVAAVSGSDTLAALPKDYGQAAVPALGPPLPGDLGRAIVDQQHRNPVEGQTVSNEDRASQQTAAAEQQRILSQVRAAQEAGVMVQTGSARSSVLPASAATALTDAVGIGPTNDGRPRTEKEQFLAAKGGEDVYNAHGLVEPQSPYQIMAGDVIAATLITGLDSDLPGFVTAQVSDNVYDTVTGRHLLIPQGSRLLGAYDSKVAFGQKRALVVWRRLILPDGSSILLDNLPATDAAGRAGLFDEVDAHTGKVLRGIGMSTLLGVSSELALEGDGDLVRALRQSTQQSASQAGQQIVGRQLDVQPTLRVRPGWPLRVIVHKDLVLRPWRARLER